MSRTLIILGFLLIPSLVCANSYTADGSILDGDFGYTWEGDRMGLINDGSFEWGACNGQTAWTCDSDNGCDWIDDLTRYGLWNYDGIHVAWLGGRCNDIPTCYTSFCQEIVFDAPELSWWWMAYVNDEVMDVYVTVDGELVFEFAPALSDHLLDYQQHTADVSAYIDGTHTLCFGMDNTAYCEEGLVDNYFFDYIELVNTSTSVPEFAVLSVKFSDLKTLY